MSHQLWWLGWFTYMCARVHINGFMQDCINFSVLAMEFMQSCVKAIDIGVKIWQEWIHIYTNLLSTATFITATYFSGKPMKLAGVGRSFLTYDLVSLADPLTTMTMLPDRQTNKIYKSGTTPARARNQLGGYDKRKSIPHWWWINMIMRRQWNNHWLIHQSRETQNKHVQTTTVICIHPFWCFLPCYGWDESKLCST